MLRHIVLLNFSDPNLPQSSYQSDIGQAPVLFPSDPNSPMPTPIQGASFPGLYQTASTQPSPYDTNHLPPGVSPVPNGVSPGVLVAIPHVGSTAPAPSSEPIVVPQSGTVDPQQGTFQTTDESLRPQVNLCHII